MKKEKFTRYEKLIDVPIDELKSNGTELVMLDMDSTLLIWHGKEIAELEKNWCLDVMEQGIKIFIVSNAVHDRTKEIAKQLNVDFIAPAMKPAPFGILKAIKKSGAKIKTSVMIGDQMLTDKTAAMLAGVKFILVEPMSDVEFGMTKMNRKLEKLFFGREIGK